VGELDEFRQRSRELRERGREIRESLESADLSNASPSLVSTLRATIDLLDDTQKKLAKSEHLVFGIFEGSLDAFLLTNDDYQFVDMNQAAAELYGLPKDSLLGRTGAEFAAPGYDISKTRQLFSSTGQLVGEFPLRRANGEERIVEFAAKANIVPGLHFSVMRDVTERVRLEDQLRQAHKMEAVGALAGGIAHDFNNLLSVILSYTDLTMAELKRDDPIRAELQEVSRAANRAADLTHQLLAFSRRQVLQPQVVDLNVIVSNLETMLRRILGEHIGLTVLPARTLWPVFVDRGQLEQVVMNLVVNARDAMSDGGSLTIETANLEIDEAHAARHVDLQPGSYVMLAVTDTGAGMDKTVLSRIFEPFFTTKKEGEGTGLGLATVFGIVRQSGGNVCVYSEPGKGSSFKVYFPRSAEVADEMRPKVSRTDAPPATTGGSETILLVEDEEQVRVLVRTILRRKGYNILEARNAGEAFLLCEGHAGTIHLLLTDVVMPMMSGQKLGERLASMRPEMKVLFMSGYTNSAIVNQGVLDSGIAFLQKPITVASLLRHVRNVLDAKGRDPARQ
jgi:two-component system, cell cycle sensor histidine kinase and response regulator CckA